MIVDFNSIKDNPINYIFPFVLIFTQDPAGIIIFTNDTTNIETKNPNQQEIYSFILNGQDLCEIQYELRYRRLESDISSKNIHC